MNVLSFNQRKTKRSRIVRSRVKKRSSLPLSLSMPSLFERNSTATNAAVKCEDRPSFGVVAATDETRNVQGVGSADPGGALTSRAITRVHSPVSAKRKLNGTPLRGKTNPRRALFNAGSETGYSGMGGRRLYVDAPTVRAIMMEVDALPLPATVANVALALVQSDHVLGQHAVSVGSSFLSSKKGNGRLEEVGNDESVLSFLSQIHISPREEEAERKERLKEALNELVPGGTSTLLKKWSDVYKALSKVLVFPASLNGKIKQDEDLIKLGAQVEPHRSTLGSNPMRLSRKRFLNLDTYRKLLEERVRPRWKQIRNHRPPASREPSRVVAAVDRRLEKSIEIAEVDARAKESAVKARVEAAIVEKEERERKAAEESERQIAEARERASSLLRPMTEEESVIVRDALYGIGPESEILASTEADSVQRGSMYRLQPGRWVNDEVISYFLKNCLSNRDDKLCIEDPKRKRSHFFNSFFVQSLFDEKNFNPNKQGVYNYKNVKRWSKKVPGKDIFNLRYVFCPINLNNSHWTCAVIFIEEKKIQYYDSMGSTEWDKLEGLLQYLKDDHQSKKGCPLPNADQWELLGCADDTPQQLNGYDCGVFTCMFCDFISKDCPLSFTQEHVNQCRERIALSIMRNCAIV